MPNGIACWKCGSSTCGGWCKETEEGTHSIWGYDGSIQFPDRKVKPVLHQGKALPTFEPAKCDVCGVVLHWSPLVDGLPEMSSVSDCGHTVKF